MYNTVLLSVSVFSVIKRKWSKVPEMLCEGFNTLNVELNPICHLLALLGAHHILHVSRIRVNYRPTAAATAAAVCILYCFAAW